MKLYSHLEAYTFKAESHMNDQDYSVVEPFTCYRWADGFS